MSSLTLEEEGGVELHERWEMLCMAAKSNERAAKVRKNFGYWNC